MWQWSCTEQQKHNSVHYDSICNTFRLCNKNLFRCMAEIYFFCRLQLKITLKQKQTWLHVSCQVSYICFYDTSVYSKFLSHFPLSYTVYLDTAGGQAFTVIRHWIATSSMVSLLSLALVWLPVSIVTNHINLRSVIPLTAHMWCKIIYVLH